MVVEPPDRGNERCCCNGKVDDDENDECTSPADNEKDADKEVIFSFPSFSSSIFFVEEDMTSGDVGCKT